MYEKILVALDGSKLSEGILPYAHFISAKLTIPVELVHVIDTEIPIPAASAQQPRYQDVMSAEKKHSMDYLKKIAASFDRPATVDCAVEIGKPAEVIVDRAAANRSTLIAMTTHGRSGINRWLLGSVADKVLHAAANPLLLVRAKEKTEKTEAIPLKRVLVPLDGSQLAEMVLPHAAALAWQMGLGIVLLRVYGFPTPVFAEDYGPYVEELWTQLETETQEYLDQKARELKAQGLANVSTVVLGGFGAEKIIEVAQQGSETLVAMCTHGRSGVNRWVMGSVTDRVVRHSGDPVLIIRATSGNA